MLGSPQKRKKAEEEYTKIQGRMRLAFAKGSTETIEFENLSLEHIKLLKQAWEQDFIFAEDGTSIRLKT